MESNFLKNRRKMQSLLKYQKIKVNFMKGSWKICKFHQSITEKYKFCQNIAKKANFLKISLKIKTCEFREKITQKRKYHQNVAKNTKFMKESHTQKKMQISSSNHRENMQILSKCRKKPPTKHLFRERITKQLERILKKMRIL